MNCKENDAFAVIMERIGISTDGSVMSCVNSGRAFSGGLEELKFACAMFLADCVALKG